MNPVALARVATCEGAALDAARAYADAWGDFGRHLDACDRDPAGCAEHGWLRCRLDLARDAFRACVVALAAVLTRDVEADDDAR